MSWESDSQSYADAAVRARRKAAQIDNEIANWKAEGSMLKENQASGNIFDNPDDSQYSQWKIASKGYLGAAEKKAAEYSRFANAMERKSQKFADKSRDAVEGVSIGLSILMFILMLL